MGSAQKNVLLGRNKSSNYLPPSMKTIRVENPYISARMNSNKSSGGMNGHKRKTKKGK